MATKTAAAVKPEKEQKSSFLLETLKRTVESPSAKLGAILIAVMILISVFAPLIAPYEPNAIDVKAILQSPSSEHIMGTDSMGRDVFSRILYGGRYSLAVGICASLFGALLGIIIGCIAGYFGGIV
ncbi:MAG: ABC transporter permease, partial [Clostridiales bacterium]|nr:ABC transporter permease [Clostridiales bacterium]